MADLEVDGEACESEEDSYRNPSWPTPLAGLHGHIGDAELNARDNQREHPVGVAVAAVTGESCLDASTGANADAEPETGVELATDAIEGTAFSRRHVLRILLRLVQVCFLRIHAGALPINSFAQSRFWPAPQCPPGQSHQSSITAICSAKDGMAPGGICSLG